MSSSPLHPDPGLRRLLLPAVAALLTLLSALPVPALDCTQPPGATRVNDSYQPDPWGDWWQLTEYADDGPANGQINLGDTFAFTDGSGQPILLADPTILRLTSAHGTWYYITGTSDGYFTANFAIYRTQDFSRFELHMLAFAESNQWGSNQWRSGSRRYLNGTWYTNLWSPHLYVDPTHGDWGDRHLFLSFAAVEQGTDPHNDQSVYLVRIRQSDFLAWHTRNPVNDDGPHFADVRSGLGFQQWYYYNTANDQSGAPYLYDGGWTVRHLIPASGSPGALLGSSCGQLETRSRGFSHRCQGAATWMIADSWVFFDPNRSASDPWKRILLYTWADANPNVSTDMWGNHIAAHPLLSNNIQFDVNAEVFPIAMDRNDNNRVNGLDNGVVDLKQQAWYWGGVAEGATAFYHPATGRYYVLYARNTWDSAAYQILYRMTEPGAPFSSIRLPWFGDQTAPEHILLRATDYTDGGKANFGSPEIFTIRDEAGQDHFYVLYHVKFDYESVPGVFTGRRTVMLKELTVKNAAAGTLMRLYEASTSGARDIRRLRIPRCRQ